MKTLRRAPFEAFAYCIVVAIASVFLYVYFSEYHVFVAVFVLLALALGTRKYAPESTVLKTLIALLVLVAVWLTIMGILVFFVHV